MERLTSHYSKGSSNPLFYAEMVRAVADGGRIYMSLGPTPMLTLFKSPEFVGALNWAREEKNAKIHCATDPVLLVEGTKSPPLFKQATPHLFTQLIHRSARTSAPNFFVVEEETADEEHPKKYLLYLERPHKPLPTEEELFTENLRETEVDGMAQWHITLFTGWANEIEELPESLQKTPPLEMTQREYAGIVRRAQVGVFNYLDPTELRVLYAEALGQRARPASPGIREAVDELLNLAALEGDWDSYGGQPPTPRALRGARKLLLGVDNLFFASAQDRIRPFAVVPLANGGVQIEWRTNQQDVEVEINPRGVLSYLTVVHDNLDNKYGVARVSQKATLEMIGETIQ